MKKLYRQIAGSAIAISGSAIASLTLASNAHALSLTTYQTYTQNFDTLANSGTNNTSTPDGWYFDEIGGGSDDQYEANDGSATQGGAYSFGTAGSPTNSTERAFGTIQNGSRYAVLGALFNITAPVSDPITSLVVQYYGEQWSRGFASATTPDRLDFQYSLNAGSLTDTLATWTDFDALDFSSVVNNGPASALNGNVNRQLVSGEITGLNNLTAGTKIWLRWVDWDRPGGAQDALAIDEFSVKAVPTPALLPGLIGLGLGAWRKRKSEPVSEEA